jgi:hypothetical protein
MFSKQDLKFIEEKGVSKSKIEHQIEQFKKGFPVLGIIKSAVNRDGIKQLNEKQLAEFTRKYSKAPNRLKRVKFVPASGAATRMFKKLYDLIQNYKGTEAEYLDIITDKSFNSINYMFQNLKSFAFYNDLIQALDKNNLNICDIIRDNNYPQLFNVLLEEHGLNYGNLPKGLLKFHKTIDAERTPVYEHLIEGIEYAASGKKVNLHFTVSLLHLELFIEHVNAIKPALQKQFKVKFKISYSIQKPSTDTIAVDSENNPIHDENGNLVFRPGGHGALIYNLNDIDADLIFIKNIDNVVQDRIKGDTYIYKKALAGMLLCIREKAMKYHKKLNRKVKDEFLCEVEEFVRKTLFVIPPANFSEWHKDKKNEFLRSKINRPIRVCGMVRNEGEPGGGPFWVEASDGSVSLQIVEGSQFAPYQKELLNNATHFNPVDIVCSTKDFKGKKYDLTKFIDENAGFISTKSINGKEIKALELPGLWNGAMANWNTIFVEVPATTFNPVKTINDLLRAEHLFENDMLQLDEDASDNMN